MNNGNLKTGFNYDKHGKRYSNYRQTDPIIAQFVIEALW